MKTLIRRSFALLAGTLIMAAFPVAANALTITVVTTFDYPGIGNSTFPFGINNAGDIAGYYLDASGVTRGFTRLKTGALSRPIVDPGATNNVTRAIGINLARTVVGDYQESSLFYHGFFLTGRTFTTLDFSGTVGSDLFAINDAGDFGGAGFDGTNVQAYVSLGGTQMVIPIAGSTLSAVHGLNNLAQAVGIYQDSALAYHGFLLNTNGTITAPLDYPGALNTMMQGISDKGLIVGRYTGTDGIDHAFLLKLPHTFVSFDYPGATATSFNGINAKGVISARYTTADGLAHGFIAQAR